MSDNFEPLFYLWDPEVTGLPLPTNIERAMDQAIQLYEVEAAKSQKLIALGQELKEEARYGELSADLSLTWGLLKEHIEQQTTAAVDLPLPSNTSSHLPMIELLKPLIVNYQVVFVDLLGLCLLPDGSRLAASSHPLAKVT